VKQSWRHIFYLALTFFYILEGDAGAASFSWPIAPDPKVVPIFSCQIENRYPHDPSAFTQGLVFDAGLFWEGTGLYGLSDLRRVEVSSGKVLERLALPQHLFGEGIALFDDKIYQLTWRSHEVRIYDRDPLTLRKRLFWPYQGWGITVLDPFLLISNGTETLYVVDPESFKIRSEIEVREKEKPLRRLNELERVGHYIFANVWQTSRIAVILPKSGQVAAWIDLSAISKNEPAGVANGIAWDSTNRRLFVTGKKWSWTYEVTLKSSP